MLVDGARRVVQPRGEERQRGAGDSSVSSLCTLSVSATGWPSRSAAVIVCTMREICVWLSGVSILSFCRFMTNLHEYLYVNSWIDSWVKRLPCSKVHRYSGLVMRPRSLASVLADEGLYSYLERAHASQIW